MRRTQLRNADHQLPGVVSFSAGDYWYHSHTHADFQIAHELARTRPVLIVNSMGMRMPSLGSADGWMRVRRKLKSISRCSYPFTEPGPLRSSTRCS
jgi:hypothetical protein